MVAGAAAQSDSVGNSPYQAMSSFAGNAMLISPGGLVLDELLAVQDCEASFPSDVVDCDAVVPFKMRLLERAWKNFKAGRRKDLRLEYDEFCAEQGHWLEDYALFRALKAKYAGAYYLDWPEDLVQRSPAALASARRELANQIDQVRFAQFLLFRQGDQLKAFAHSKGVRLIGDLPFFVSPDSSDVWSNPELFLLDEYRRPRFVAGVPPDYFQRAGTVVGQSRLQLGRPTRDGLSAVD
jgi:4-alpha-glucanotransferase